MEPNIWGPGAWIFLHSITLNYPYNPTIQDKKTYLDFFNNLHRVLPCSVCKTNYKKHLSSNPVNFHLQSKQSLVKWLIEIHNQANKSAGKPIVTFDEFMKIYKNLYKNPDKSIIQYKNHNAFLKKCVYFLLLTIVILVVILIMYKKTFK